MKTGPESLYERRLYAVCDLEMFLAELSNGDIPGIKLKDMLLYLTGYDTMPPHGLYK